MRRHRDVVCVSPDRKFQLTHWTAIIRESIPTAHEWFLVAFLVLFLTRRRLGPRTMSILAAAYFVTRLVLGSTRHQALCFLHLK
jgi:hypothetical protein